MDWNKVKTEYITTSISYRKLADKYDISRSTLLCRAKRENWFEAKKDYQAKIVAKSVQKAESKAVDYKSTLYDLAFKVAKQLSDMTDEMSISQLSAMGIKPRDITGAIKYLEDVLHVKSESDLKEQEARIAKLRKEASANDNDDGKTYGVLILPPVGNIEAPDTEGK